MAGMEPQAIVSLYNQLRQERGMEIQRMHELQRAYNGDIVVPLPELDDAEKPAVANLVAQGIDQLAARISSRLPDVAFVPISRQDREVKRAADARKVILGWWDMNRLEKRFYRRGRFHVGYGSSPVMVKPVASHRSNRKIPHWPLLNPLATYPVHSGDPDDIHPSCSILLRQQSLAWLQKNYPAQAATLYKGREPRPQTLFDLLEYNNCDETVLVVCGRPRDPNDYADFERGVSTVELLERDENRAGMPLLVCPGRITLDRLQGHFDGVLGMFKVQARMNAYEQIAVFRSIFPELWVVSHPNAPTEARIIQVADGKQGIIGEIANGTIQPIQPQPSVQVPTTIDRLERSIRVQAGIPADWGGESGSNIRTARRGEQVMGSAIDPIIGEAQTIFSESFEKEDEIAIAIAKAYGAVVQL